MSLSKTIVAIRDVQNILCVTHMHILINASYTRPVCPGEFGSPLAKDCKPLTAAATGKALRGDPQGFHSKAAASLREVDGARKNPAERSIPEAEDEVVQDEANMDQRGQRTRRWRWRSWWQWFRREEENLICRSCGKMWSGRKRTTNQAAFDTLVGVCAFTTSLHTSHNDPTHSYEFHWASRSRHHATLLSVRIYLICCIAWMATVTDRQGRRCLCK